MFHHCTAVCLNQSRLGPQLRSMFIFGGKTRLGVASMRCSHSNAAEQGLNVLSAVVHLHNTVSPHTLFTQTFKQFHECWPSLTRFCPHVIDPFMASVWFMVKFFSFLPGANLRFAGIVVSHRFLFFSSLFEMLKRGCVHNLTQWISKSEALRSKVVQTSQPRSYLIHANFPFFIYSNCLWFCSPPHPGYDIKLCEAEKNMYFDNTSKMIINPILVFMSAW